MKTACYCSITAGVALLTAADPTEAVYWSAGKTKDLDKQAASRLNKESGLGTSRLMDSAFILYREGNSMAEIHTKLADMIVARDGECTMLVGGKIVDGKPSGQDEIRGASIEGANEISDGGGRYALCPGQHRPSVRDPAGKALHGDHHQSHAEARRE